MVKIEPQSQEKVDPVAASSPLIKPAGIANGKTMAQVGSKDAPKPPNGTKSSSAAKNEQTPKVKLPQTSSTINHNTAPKEQKKSDNKSTNPAAKIVQIPRSQPQSNKEQTPQPSTSTSHEAAAPGKEKSSQIIAKAQNGHTHPDKNKPSSSQFAGVKRVAAAPKPVVLSEMRELRPVASTPKQSEHTEKVLVATAASPVKKTHDENLKKSPSSPTTSGIKSVIKKRRVEILQKQRAKPSNIVIRVKSPLCTKRDRSVQVQLEDEIAKFFRALPSCSHGDSKTTLNRMKSLIGEESFKALESLFQPQDSPEPQMRNSKMRARSFSCHSKSRSCRNEVEKLLIDVADSFIGEDVTKICTKLRSKKSNAHDDSSVKEEDDSDLMKTRRGTKLRPQLTEVSDSDSDSDAENSEDSTDGISTDDEPLNVTKRKIARRISETSDSSTDKKAENPAAVAVEPQLNIEVDVALSDSLPSHEKLDFEKKCYLKGLDKIDIESLGIKNFYEETDIADVSQPSEPTVSTEPTLNSPAVVNDTVVLESSDVIANDFAEENASVDVKPTNLIKFPPTFDFETVIVIDDDEDEFINSNKAAAEIKENIAEKFTTISNLSYGNKAESTQVVYRCIPPCTFVCENLENLRYHIGRHVTDKFTGYCQLCKKHVKKNISSLKDELEHMEWHVINGADKVMPDPAQIPMKKRRFTIDHVPHSRKKQRLMSTDRPPAATDRTPTMVAAHENFSKKRDAVKTVQLPPSVIPSKTLSRTIPKVKTPPLIAPRPPAVSPIPTTATPIPAAVAPPPPTVEKPTSQFIDLDAIEVSPSLVRDIDIISLATQVEKEPNNNTTTATTSSAPQPEVARSPFKSPSPPKAKSPAKPVGIRIRALPGDILSGRITPKKTAPEIPTPQPAVSTAPSSGVVRAPSQLFTMLTSASQPPPQNQSAPLQIMSNMQQPMRIILQPQRNGQNQPARINATNVFYSNYINVNGSVMTQHQVQSVVSSASSSTQSNSATTSVQVANQIQRVQPASKVVVIEPIRPWLAEFENETKSIQAKFAMVANRNCLLNLFKCMDTDCYYSCNEANVFLAHIKQHANSQKITSGMADYNKCAYCMYKGITQQLLVLHIINDHKHDKFACSKCFYSSVNPTNVQLHFQKHHKKFMLANMVTILTRNNLQMIDHTLQIALFKKNRSFFVDPIPCSGEFYRIL